FNAALYPTKIESSELSISSQLLGSGAFANVFKGHLMASSLRGTANILGLRAVSDIYDDGRKPVAVKVLHDHLADAH
ncbi:hypothetical protein AAVH_08554, partial [Aphelenchoides avenae]